MPKTGLLYAACCALSLILAGPAAAQDKGVIKIGILSDLSGYTAPLTGEGSVAAAQLAVDDFGGTVAGYKVEVVSGDHQNKADIGAALARQWFDVEGVDVIADLPNSAVALAVQELGRDYNKVVLHSAAGTPALTGKACTENGIHWARNTYALAASIGKAVVAAGGKSWYFITADYAFGHSAEAEVGKVVVENGGEVLGSIRHPQGTNDFSSYLLQAQASGAQVVAFANAGADATNAIKQAQEFGLTAGGQTMVGLTLFLTDINALGLQAAQGLQITDVFYWDQNDATREWSKRFFEKRQAMPTAVQADAYSAVTHYLKAVEAGADPRDGKAVVAQMKSIPISGPLLPSGTLREDGRSVREMYLYRIKTPEESKYDWDYYELIGTVPGEDMVRPLSESECPLVSK